MGLFSQSVPLIPFGEKDGVEQSDSKPSLRIHGAHLKKHPRKTTQLHHHSTSITDVAAKLLLNHSGNTMEANEHSGTHSGCSEPSHSPQTPTHVSTSLRLPGDD
ncbi:hypothetical protein SRHO_G00269300 [Serrasalmus rhombeus]